MSTDCDLVISTSMRLIHPTDLDIETSEPTAGLSVAASLMTAQFDASPALRRLADMAEDTPSTSEHSQ